MIEENTRVNEHILQFSLELRELMKKHGVTIEYEHDYDQHGYRIGSDCYFGVDSQAHEIRRIEVNEFAG